MLYPEAVLNCGKYLFSHKNESSRSSYRTIYVCLNTAKPMDIDWTGQNGDIDFLFYCAGLVCFY